MESEISEFLIARISEIEQKARAASPSPWTYPGIDSVAGGMFYDKTRTIGGVHYEQPDEHDGSIVRHLLNSEADSNGRHIVQHDPAYVLADCAAKRKIIEFHENWPVLVEEPPKLEFSPDHGFAEQINAHVMRMTQQVAWMTTREYIDKFVSEPPTAPMLKAMVQPFADHPDFNPKWKM